MAKYKKRYSKCITRKIKTYEEVNCIEKTIKALKNHISMTPTSFYLNDDRSVARAMINGYEKKLLNKNGGENVK